MTLALENKKRYTGLPVAKNPPANAEDMVQEDPTCCGATEPLCHS